MKKILASIILLLAFVHHSNAQFVAQDYGDATDLRYGVDLDVTASAVVIIPLVAAKVADLRFGKLATAAPGTMKMSATSATTRVTTGGVVKLNTDSADVGPGQITVSGDASFTFEIFVDEDITLTTLSGAADEIKVMTVNEIKISGSKDKLIDVTASSAATVIYIGGTLNTVASQASGSYEGTINVYVQYE